MYEITSSAELGRLLYLSQIDAQIQQFMTRKNTFIFDLATRLLLEGGVVVTDVYFFISDQVAADIDRRNESWIWNGLRRGLIVPAFREKGVSSFEENLQRGVRPTTTVGVRNDDREIAIKLDAAISGRDTPKITWPDGVGISFGRLINSEFNLTGSRRVAIFGGTTRGRYGTLVDHCARSILNWADRRSGILR